MENSKKPVSRETAMAFGKDVYFGHGKIEISSKVVVTCEHDIAIAFTPGVGNVVKAISAQPDLVHEQTAKDNFVALVTDGSAVLGFGDVGPYAGIPVMEGKSVMFKLLAGVDCMPLSVKTNSADELVSLIRALEPSFGGFVLEDVAAPICFEVMEKLEGTLSVPIMHDDQYGTATAIVGALINAFRVLDRDPATQRAVVCGCGAAGTACVDMLRLLGVKDIVVVEKDGILNRTKSYSQGNWQRIAEQTNEEGLDGDLAAAMQDRDLFIGLSVRGIVTPEMIGSMNDKPIVFSLANPEPEILPDLAFEAGAGLVASGRFDFPNHCNNVLAFPGLIRGAIDTKARSITPGMCMAAAQAIADDVPASELSLWNISPSPMSSTLFASVAEATARAAVETGVARHDPGVGAVASHTDELRKLAHENCGARSRDGN